MDNRPFVEAFRDLNASYLKLVDSLSALRALSSLSVGKNSDEELLENALAVLVDNQDLERCSIYLLQDDRLVNVAGLSWDDLICVERPKVEGPAECKPTFELGEGVVGLAAQCGEIQQCNDCGSDHQLFPHCSSCYPEMAEWKEIGKGIVGSVISAPICIGEEVLGVLSVSHPHSHFFDEGHVRTLRIFCNVLGQLLKNNRLFQEMDQKVRHRTRQLQQALEDAEELKRRYERLSVIDDLTQLHNRRFFFPECRAALARNIREQLPFSLLLLDVDHFKQINDNFGHAAGDVLLSQVASQVKAQIREGDILARFGGEEFILALPNTDQSGAMLLAERIRAAIKDVRQSFNDSVITVSLSIGISGASDYSEQDSQKMLDRFIMEADQALYFGKQHGRDQSRNYADIACEI